MRLSKKKVGIIGAVTAFLVLAIILCPGEKRHYNAICAVADDLLDDDLSSKESGNTDLWSMLTSELGDDAFEAIVKNRLIVKNRGVYSVGGFEKDSRFKVVSFGCMGFVFTFDKEDLERVIDENNDKVKFLRGF